MLDAISKHEDVHVSRGLPALVDVSVLDVSEATIEAESTPSKSKNRSQAIVAIKAGNSYKNAAESALTKWRLVCGGYAVIDHDISSGGCYNAERSVVNPMIKAIDNHAAAQTPPWL